MVPANSKRLLVMWMILCLCCLRSMGQRCDSVAQDFHDSIVHIRLHLTHQDTGAIDEVEGTGFIISQNGYLLSNYHVIAAPSNTKMTDISGAVGSRNANRIPMVILAKNPESDIALLQLQSSFQLFKPVIIGQPASVSVGSQLCSIGFPLQQEFLFSKGPLSGTTADNGYWLSGMPSNDGESGAPVFDDKTETVVGIKVAASQNGQNINFIIPINLANTYIQMAPSYGPLPRGTVQSSAPPIDQISLPAGNATVYNGFQFYGQSGFSFGKRTIVGWDSSDYDIGVANPGKTTDPAVFFVVNDAPPYTDPKALTHAIINAGIQEMPVGGLDEVRECPVSNYSVHYFVPGVGKVYCFRTRDGQHWAKLKIVLITPDRISFDYVYQPSGSRYF